MDTKIDQIDINGVKYVRADQVPPPVPNGKRAVLVLDRGWIFAGDVTEKDGRVYLARAVHVLSWTGGQGFAGMIADPKRNVNLKKMSTTVDFPTDAELFRNPVSDDWGL